MCNSLFKVVIITCDEQGALICTYRIVGSVGERVSFGLFRPLYLDHSRPGVGAMGKMQPRMVNAGKLVAEATVRMSVESPMTFL